MLLNITEKHCADWHGKERDRGYLGFTEFIGVQIRFLGLEGLQRILTKISWILEEFHEIESIYILFSLRKA
ncbi:hypothetical protein PAALTS15_00495 [Paenibacillus alvei TS-15]|uniref:Uncharacterized protein n=1 Tax=Paenibacillus alvei TS-15 TaxID=1117108 RepID=S9U424_PAEAL|nr:hypothetical protein PAALTS15_00495 [Paenibacillus alvei TS-15]